MASPAVATVASLVDFAEVGVIEITLRDRRGALDGPVCDCGGCCDGRLGSWNDEDQDDWGGCPSGTFLADPVGVITGEMTFRERCGVLGGLVCDDCCDCVPDNYDCSPDYFDYDGPEDFGHCPDVYGFGGLDEYGLCRYFPGDCELCCVSRGDAGVIPYESGTEGIGVDENSIAF